MQHLLTIFPKCVFQNVLSAMEFTITLIPTLAGAYRHAQLPTVNSVTTPLKLVSQNV